jgi:Right handed beta helix region
MPARTFSIILSITSFFAANARQLHVSTTGESTGTGSSEAPFGSIQKACDAAQPGDTVAVARGTYKEKIRIKRSGTAGNFVTLQAAEGVIISGKGVEGSNIILVENQDYIRIIGFEIRDNLHANDGSGIRIEGRGSHIEISNTRIHEIRGKDAMGITVYGTNKDSPIQHLIIDGNEIYDCDPARSEALTLNGNISDFQVINNKVHDVNNIGIDLIGGEAWTGDPSKVTRNGVCSGNTVYRCRSSYGEGYAAGIYIDGGHDIVVENNVVTQCDLGIEVGAENKGSSATRITLRNNKIYSNDKAGIVFGGYEKKAGRVQGCTITGNICAYNHQHREDHNGELWVQWADGNTVTGNTFVVKADAPLAQLEQADNLANTINNNRYYTDAGERAAYFLVHGNDIEGFASWKTTTKFDQGSTFGSVELGLPDK